MQTKDCGKVSQILEQNSKQYTFLIYNANKVVVLINKILINFSVVARFSLCFFVTSCFPITQIIAGKKEINTMQVMETFWLIFDVIFTSFWKVDYCSTKTTFLKTKIYTMYFDGGFDFTSPSNKKNLLHKCDYKKLKPVTTIKLSGI